MTGCVCPVCGQTAELPPIVVLQERGMAISGGRFVTLTVKEAAFLAILVKRAPRVTTKESLMNVLYVMGSDEEPMEKIIDVYACKVRKKLRRIGVEIVTHWGAGYSIALEGGQVITESGDD